MVLMFGSFSLELSVQRYCQISTVLDEDEEEEEEGKARLQAASIMRKRRKVNAVVNRVINQAENISIKFQLI